MLRLTRTHRLLSEFVPAVVCETPGAPLVEIETLTWADLPAARVTQRIEKKHLISLVRLAGWVTLISNDRAQVLGASFDTDENIIELLVVFLTEVHRTEFQVGVQDSLAG